MRCETLTGSARLDRLDDLAPSAVLDVFPDLQPLVALTHPAAIGELGDVEDLLVAPACAHRLPPPQDGTARAISPS